MHVSKRVVIGGTSLAVVAAGIAAGPASLAGKPPAQTISVVQVQPSGTALTAKEGQPSAVSIVVNRANSTGTAMFNLTPFDNNTNGAADYTQLWTNPVTIGPGATTATLLMSIVNDTVAEPTESVTLKLTSASAVTQIGKKNTATLTITDNDPCPAVSVNDSSATEASPVQFTVSTAGAATCALPIQVHWATVAGGTATAGADYNSPQSGNVAIPAGGTSTTFNVSTNGDTTDEPAETFNVQLSAPVNTSLADANGVGTINDDDAAPTLSIADNSSAEGNSGQSGKSFTVSVSGPSASAIDVHWSTSTGGATATGYNIGDIKNDCAHNGSDGTDLVSDQGSLHFAASGSTPASQNIVVQVCGDTTLEPNETYFVELDTPVYATISDFQALGTIQNDEVDTDGDGVSDANDLCPGTTLGDPVNATGCSASQVDTDADGVPDVTDNCPFDPNPGQEDVDGGSAGEPCDVLTPLFDTTAGTENGNYGTVAGVITNTVGHPNGTYDGQLAGGGADASGDCGVAGFTTGGTVTLTYGGNSVTVTLDDANSRFCLDVDGGSNAASSYNVHWQGAITGGTGDWSAATGTLFYDGHTSAQDGGGIRTDTGSWTGTITIN